METKNALEDTEVISFMGLSFFEPEMLTSPSPVKIILSPEEWIEKIISCGIEAYQAQLSKREMDKIVVKTRSINPVQFTNVQVNFSQLKQKFEDEFVEFHRKHDADFISEVRSGNIAKNLLRFKGTEASVEDFTYRLVKYFIDKGLTLPAQHLFSTP